MRAEWILTVAIVLAFPLSAAGDAEEKAECLNLMNAGGVCTEGASPARARYIGRRGEDSQLNAVQSRRLPVSSDHD
jgi:hypothetical protein